MTTRYFNVKQGITTGNITLDAASANITGVGNLSVVGKTIANFFQGDGGLLSNIAGANVTGQVGNALVAGTVYSSAQPNITSLGSLTSLDVTGNVTAGNVYANAGTIAALNIGGTLTTAAQPNVTSVGNLTSLQVGDGVSNVVMSGGNLTATGTITALNFSGNVSGNITGNVSAAGNVTEIQFNKDNILAATSAFTFNDTSNVLTVNGNIVSLNANLGNLATANFVSGTLTTAAQPNITSVGTLTSLAVTGNVSAGNISATLVGGTLSTAAQPNVTSVGTLTSLDVSGAVIANAITANSSISTTGNVDAGNVVVTSDVSAGTLTSDSLTAKSTNDLDLVAGTGNANVVLTPSGTGTVDVSNKRITQVATPTDDTDAANKGYVDSVAQGLDVKASVKAATAAALPAVTYNNGTAGVGATLTADATGALPTIDGATLAQGDRVLVKNQASATQNGIYVVTTLGDAGTAFVLTRATDFDQGSPSGEIPAGFTFVEEGTSYADTGWVCTTNAPVTVGTTNITFSQFSGAGQYAAGEGLTLTGTTFSVNVDDSTIEINADSLRVKAGITLITPDIGVANGTSLTTTGNVSANNLVSTNDVSGVTGTFSGNVSAANITVTGDISANTIAGNLTTATQANITSVGTLSGLTVSGLTSLGPVGNVSITGGTDGYVMKTDGAGNLTWTNPAAFVSGSNTQIQFNDGGVFGATGNLTFNKSSNTLTVDKIVADGNGLSNIAGANVTGQVGNALVAGTVYTNAQPNITSVGTLANLTATGTIDFTGAGNVALGTVANVHIGGGSDGQYLKTDGNGALTWGTVDTDTLANGTSSVDIPVINGNVNVTVGGIANVLVVTTTGANVTGTLGVTGNVTADNVNGGNLVTANFFSGDGSALSSITGANVSGQVGNALVAGTVYTAAQPNITSVGTLTSLTVSGNATVGNVVLNGGLTSNRSNVSVSGTPTVIDQFAPATFRTAKYVISASGDYGYQSVEALLVHDGSQAYITIYGSVCSNVTSDIVEVSSNIDGVSGNVTLFATSSSPNAKVNIVAGYINV